MGSRALAVLCLLAVSASALLAPALAVPGGGDDGCEAESAGRDKAQALRLKIIAIFCILVGSAIGAGLPSLGRRFPALRPETDLFLAVKAFAGGVILATGLVHILPAAFETLRSPCLVSGPWKRFPFAGLVAMLAAITTLIVDTVATGYFHRTNAKRAAAVTDEPAHDDRAARGDLESASEGHHGHAHGMSVLAAPPDGDELVRHRVISQVSTIPSITYIQWIKTKQSVAIDSGVVSYPIGWWSCLLCCEGVGARRGCPLADHRDVAGRLRLPEHGAAAGAGVDVPPALRGHRARRLHRSGQVPAQVRGGDGAALLPDDPGGDRRRHRDILGLRREQPDGAGGAGAAGGGRGGDTGVHGARGHPGRGLQQA